MNKEDIQKKKKELEKEFEKLEKMRQQAEATTQKYTEALIRMQGAYTLLVELEKEFDKNEEEIPNQNPNGAGPIISG